MNDDTMLHLERCRLLREMKAEYAILDNARLAWIRGRRTKHLFHAWWHLREALKQDELEMARSCRAWFDSSAFDGLTQLVYPAYPAVNFAAGSGDTNYLSDPERRYHAIERHSAVGREPCTHCNGAGSEGDDECLFCGGEGFVEPGHVVGLTIDGQVLYGIDREPHQQIHLADADAYADQVGVGNSA